MGWGSLLPLLLVLVLMAMATRRDWGAGAENAPYLGALVVFLAFLPAFGWKAGRHLLPERVGRIPFLPALGVLYALYFGFPVLLDDDFDVPTLQGDGTSLIRALELAAVGWVTLLLGWCASRSFTRKLRPLSLPLDPRRARRAIPVFLAVGFAAILAQRSLSLPGGLTQPVRFLQMLFQVGIALLALQSFRRELTGRENLLLWAGLVPAYLFLQVGHGSVAQLAYAGIFLLFLAWGAGRRVPLLALVLGGTVVLVMRGHVHEFRSEAWSEEGSQSESGVWERSIFFVELLAERFSEDPAGAFDEAFQEVSARVAHLSTLSHVAKLTPSRVEYWGGDTYATLPTTFIPRALWPNKPSKEIGQAFGHRFELLAPTDRTTAVNLPMLVEFYANFGALGVALGMALLGMIYQALHTFWNHPGSGDGTLILASLLFSRLILIESDFSLVFGALLQNTVLLVFLMRWLGPEREPSGSSARELVQAGGMA